LGPQPPNAKADDSGMDRSTAQSNATEIFFIPISLLLRRACGAKLAKRHLLRLFFRRPRRARVLILALTI
jgi:hypothetical protein